MSFNTAFGMPTLPTTGLGFGQTIVNGLNNKLGLYTESNSRFGNIAKGVASRALAALVTYGPIECYNHPFLKTLTPVVGLFTLYNRAWFSFLYNSVTAGAHLVNAAYDWRCGKTENAKDHLREVARHAVRIPLDLAMSGAVLPVSYLTHIATLELFSNLVAPKQVRSLVKRAFKFIDNKIGQNNAFANKVVEVLNSAFFKVKSIIPALGDFFFKREGDQAALKKWVRVSKIDRYGQDHFMYYKDEHITNISLNDESDRD